MTLPEITYPLTIIHKPDADPYPVWGGVEGVQKAHDAGATAIDIDGQADEDGIFHAVHWANIGSHGWVSPYKGLMGPSIREMTATQVKTFTFRHDGHVYTIHTAREVMTVAAALGVTVCLEVKSMGDFEQLAEDAEATGCKLIVMTLPHLGGHNAGYARLAAAKRAGIPTLVLLNTTRYAKGQVDASKWQYVDYVKGHPEWQHGKPARVISLGGGSKYGITVAPGSARKVTAALAKKWPAAKPPVVTPPVVATPPTLSPSMQTVIATAKKYVGIHEGRSGSSWNNDNPFAAKMGWANGQAWCATFVCSVFKEAGLLGLIATPSPGVDQLSVGFKKANRWSEYPALGAVAFYGTPADLNHTGIVVAYDADTITTVEGNTNTNGSREGDGVYLKSRLRRSANVVGYGYPLYVEGVVSADPAWGKVVVTPPVVGTPEPTPPHTNPPAGWKPRIDGIDISHYQSGRLDFAAAKRAGVRFVYHKATEHTSYRDPLHNARRSQVAAAGIKFGAYHFARPSKSNGTTQAKFFLSVAKPKKGDMRAMLDLEDRGGLNDAQLQAWVEQFVAEVDRQTGKPPVLYTNYDLPRDPGCFLWRARYNPDNRQPLPLKSWTRWTAWQFSNGVLGSPNTVPGIGHCDINTLFPGFDLNRLTL